MTYISLEIRLGTVGYSVISDDRKTFHESVVKMICPSDVDILRLGCEDSHSLSHHQCAHSPGDIEGFVSRNLAKFGQQAGAPVDVCLVDLTTNPFAAVRDPLLLALVGTLGEFCRRGECGMFIVTLRELPGEQSASVREYWGRTLFYC
jgi:hypothetical protein